MNLLAPILFSRERERGSSAVPLLLREEGCDDCEISVGGREWKEGGKHGKRGRGRGERARRTGVVMGISSARLRFCGGGLLANGDA